MGVGGLFFFFPGGRGGGNSHLGRAARPVPRTVGRGGKTLFHPRDGDDRRDRGEGPIFAGRFLPLKDPRGCPQPSKGQPHRTVGPGRGGICRAPPFWGRRRLRGNDQRAAGFCICGATMPGKRDWDSSPAAPAIWPDNIALRAAAAGASPTQSGFRGTIHVGATAEWSRSVESAAIGDAGRVQTEAAVGGSRRPSRGSVRPRGAQGGTFRAAAAEATTKGPGAEDIFPPPVQRRFRGRRRPERARSFSLARARSEPRRLQGTRVTGRPGAHSGAGQGPTGPTAIGHARPDFGPDRRDKRLWARRRRRSGPPVGKVGTPGIRPQPGALRREGGPPTTGGPETRVCRT